MHPPPRSSKLCIKCAEVTTQELVPSAFGCDWRCEKCENTLHAYRLGDMVNIIQDHVFKLPNKGAIEFDKSLLTTLQVFIKSDLPAHVANNTEIEVSREAIKQHLEMTGQVPQIGKPLYANCGGVAVPFGEVVRVLSQVPLKA